MHPHGRGHGRRRTEFVTPRRALAALLAGLLLASSAAAQDRVLDLLGASGTTARMQTPGSAMSLVPMSGPVDPAEYVLGPGDVLQLNLSGSVTRSWDLVVTPEGTLYVQSVGSLAVAGTSLLEARAHVLKRVSEEYRGVSIDLRLVRPRAMLIHITGQSRLSGALEVPGSRRVSEILVDTVFAPRASRRNIELRRQTATGELRLLVDLFRFRLTGHRRLDPLLRDGDIVHIPVSSSHIGIEGAVGRPGQYEWVPGDSLSTLIEIGGGPLPETVEDAWLVRFRDATQFDSVAFRVSEVLAGRYDIALRHGDRAFLYFQPRFHEPEHATILGEVHRPGAIPLEAGKTRLTDLVRSAGGFLERADLAALRVFRANRFAGEGDPEIERLANLSRKEMTASEYEVLRARLTARREDFRVDWRRVLENRDLDLFLRAGDIVRVDPIVAAVRVEGEVRRPGLVQYDPGRTVNAYVRLAGGLSNRASRAQMRVTRAVTGQTILAKDVRSIEAGDLIWVPERGETAAWQNAQSMLLVLAQIATVILAIRR